MGTNQDTATLEQEPARKTGRTQQSEGPAAKRPAQVRRSQMAAARSVAMEAMNAPAPPTGTLLVGAANDPLEHEADAMAKHVVQSLRSGRADGAVGQRSTAASPTVRRKADVGLDGGHVSADVDSQINSARGGGKPIDTAMRSIVEPHFGQDFSNVGIHTGSQASKLTESVGAQAFAIGSDVFFAEPSMANDVGLLSHELTHVVQQGGAGGVQRKMWTKDVFSDATAEGWYKGQSEAQGVITDLIDTYLAKFQDKQGFVPERKIPGAINLLLNMERAASIWIADHVENGISDPKKQKRMAGMKEFSTVVDREIRSLRQTQSADFKTVTPLVIGSKSDKLIKYEDKHSQASSVLENLGMVVNKVVPDNGDTTEIEVDFQFPFEPSGVARIGGRFKVEASKDDDMVKVRMEMAVTAGAKVPFVQIKGEMGGYLESQAKSGADAMALVSYGLYRRFRESDVVPRGASNYLWGGNWGEDGKLSSDEWSRKMEERMFSIPTPDRATFDTDETYTAAMASHVAELKKIRDNVYVESGGLVGVSVQADVMIVSAQAAAQGLAGKRIDMTSLENTKGGAGAANKRSQERGAQMAAAISGGTRGAEAPVSRGTRGFKLSSAVSATIKGFTKIEGSSGLSVVYINDGKGGGYELKTNELEYSLKGKIPFDKLGRGYNALMLWLSTAATSKIHKSIEKVEESTPEAEKGMVDRVKGQLGNMASTANMVKALGVIHEADTPAPPPEEGKEDLVGLKISLTLDGAGDATKGAIELSRYDDKLRGKKPDVMGAKVKRTKRIVKYTFNGGGWS
jgi:hypothetical protein